MAPEYAMRGHFSIKCDVYSFGVLVLEIITGRTSGTFYDPKNAEDFLSYVSIASYISVTYLQTTDYLYSSISS